MKKTIKKFFGIIILVMALFVAASCDESMDMQAPVFTDAKDGKLSALTVNVNSTVDLIKDVKVTDNVDKTVKITVNQRDYNIKVVGTYVVEYSAVDNAGNIAKVTREINVVDQTAPFFINTNASGEMAEFSVLQFTKPEKFALIDDVVKAVRDNYDKDQDLVIEVKDEGGLDLEVAGEYTITYQVTDTKGNVGTATRKLVVKEAVKWVEDTISINGMSHPVLFNQEGIFEKDRNEGAKMRSMDQIQLLTKEFYHETIEANQALWANNGGVPFLPYCVLVVLDSDMKPVLVRNATYALEAVLRDGAWELHKNGLIIVGEDEMQDKTSFLDGTAPAATGIGITGGNLESYIPDGGYVLIASASKGGAADLGKILVLKNLINSSFGGGAVTWDQFSTEALDLLPNAQFVYEKDVTTLYEKPEAMTTPSISIEKHILSFEKITGAKEYQIFIDGELKMTTTATSIKMLDLTDGLPVSQEGTSYKVTVKAISSDIRFYGDSAVSNECEYVKVEAVQLVAPIPTIEKGVLTWTAVENASKYAIYAKQLGDAILLAEVTGTTYDLTTDAKLSALTYTANIYIVVVGDGVEFLDSEASQNVVHMCSPEQVIKLADGTKLPVVVTTAEDYFAKRNDASAIGYATKSQLYLVTNLETINETHNEAYSFIVLLNAAKQPKVIMSIVPTVNMYVNGEFVEAASVNYASNAKQIAPFMPYMEAGDMLLIGKNGCKIDGVDARQVVANLYWGANMKAAATVTEYPAFEIKLANSNELEAPVIQYSGSKVKWAEVEGATKYVVKVGTEEFELTTCEFDLTQYVKEIGKSGANALNYAEVDVTVTATAEGKVAGTTIKKVRLSATITDGTKSVNMNYNLANSLWNGGSGANFRGNDKVGVAFDGKTFKEAAETYKGGYAKNAGVVFLQNSVIVVLDSNMKLKFARYGFATAEQINADGSVTTTDLTWNNAGQNETEGGGLFKNLTNEVADNDYVLIFQNAGSKAVLIPAIEMFINTDSASFTSKAKKPSTAETGKIDYAATAYTFVFTATEVA